MNKITVVKRNGQKEPLAVEKWQAQIAKVQQEGQQDQVKTQLDQQKLQVQKDIATSQLAREFVIHRGDQAKEAAAQQHAQHEADREQTARYRLEVYWVLAFPYSPQV